MQASDPHERRGWTNSLEPRWATMGARDRCQSDRPRMLTDMSCPDLDSACLRTNLPHPAVLWPCKDDLCKRRTRTSCEGGQIHSSHAMAMQPLGQSGQTRMLTDMSCPDLDSACLRTACPHPAMLWPCKDELSKRRTRTSCEGGQIHSSHAMAVQSLGQSGQMRAC